jgi:hypothetical protein
MRSFVASEKLNPGYYYWSHCPADDRVRIFQSLSTLAYCDVLEVWPNENMSGVFQGDSNRSPVC